MPPPSPSTSNSASASATTAHIRSASAESEPFLSWTMHTDQVDAHAERSGTLERSHRSHRTSIRHAHHRRQAEHAPPRGAVSSRLLHALSPQLSQWLQPSAAATSSTSGHEAVEIDITNGRAEIDHDAEEALSTSRRRGSSASASTPSPALMHVPVTLQVLPGGGPGRAAAMPPVRPLSVRLDDDAPPSLLPLVTSTDVSTPLVVVSSTPRGADLLVSSIDAEEEPPSAAASPAVSPRSAASSDDASQSEDVSMLDEFQTLFRRCHHTLPFVALLVVYFVYQHATGILVFAVGSVAIAGLDERLRSQIALKESANRLYLCGLVAMCVVDTFVVASVGGEANPFKHLTLTLPSPSHGDEVTNPTHGVLILELLWIVVVNDFIIRFWSMALKGIVAIARPGVSLWSSGDASPSAPGVLLTDANHDLEDSGVRHKLARSNVSFYRRKRKLYGIIELCSIFLRSLLAGLPWCSYYQLCGSKFIANVFTFVYVFGKSVILGSQGRRLIQLVRSFVTLGLEHATYVTREALVEAGCPDCSICYEVMNTPVQLACTHMFCEDCVMEWFDRERSCPLCRAVIVSTSPAQGDVKPQFLDGSTSLFPQLF